MGKRLLYCGLILGASALVTYICVRTENYIVGAGILTMGLAAALLALVVKPTRQPDLSGLPAEWRWIGNYRSVGESKLDGPAQKELRTELEQSRASYRLFGLSCFAAFLLAGVAFDLSGIFGNIGGVALLLALVVLIVKCNQADTKAQVYRSVLNTPVVERFEHREEDSWFEVEHSRGMIVRSSGPIDETDTTIHPLPPEQRFYEMDFDDETLAGMRSLSAEELDGLRQLSPRFPWPALAWRAVFFLYLGKAVFQYIHPIAGILSGVFGFALVARRFSGQHSLATGLHKEDCAEARLIIYDLHARERSGQADPGTKTAEVLPNTRMVWTYEGVPVWRLQVPKKKGAEPILNP